MRKNFLSILFSITAISFVSVFAATQAQAQTNSFGGRAISVNATIGGVNAILNDTGELPPTGGFITRSLESGNLFGGALTTGELSATIQGTDIQSRSQAIVYNLNLNVGGNNIASDAVAVSSQCTCTNNGPICEGGLFGNLRINGANIAITGQPNQTITLQGGGTVIINEQIPTGSGNNAAITINGVHVIIPGLADVIISSARSNIVCGSASAPILVSGRVLNSTGRGVYNAIVTLTNSNGEVRSAITNPFGYYRFFEVAVGRTYTVMVRSKRYNFMPQVISPNNEITNLNFVAIQQ